MPSIPTSSRRDTFQTSIPSTSYSTPTSAARLSRAFSPPVSSTSYTPTVTPLGAQQKLNVVSKVAIEGKAKQDQDGVGIKMYLKISVPLDSVSPGSTIQLFPEENVKILTSQVHPLDSLSVPYNFSSTVSPLLHNAARALGLPARSQQTFHSAFNLSPPSTSASLVGTRSSKMNGSASTSSEAVPVVDSTYTGHILVSGYHISYVLPKVFPPPQPYDESSISRRRSSIGEKHHIHFMAAIDMWVPYLSRPPRSPYLLSIPTPRCLHNNIKVRIFPPTTTTSSFASLSSTDEDGTSWDLASDPHVTRSSNPSRRARANSYSTFADDESSDSSTAGFSYGCGIQGSFPSAERIRIRWAKPLKTIGLGEGEDGQKDGRRRVGVKSVKGEMTCVVRGLARNTEAEGFAGGGGGGVIMDVEYKGTCKGIWFPGVATLLGMDVGLEAKNSDVEWVNAGAGLEGYLNEWEVSGGSGYTGFDVGAGSAEAQKQRLGRYDSLDSNSGTPEIFVSPSSPAPGIASSNTAGFPRSSGSGLSARNDSTSSTASTSSLLRAPLPAPNVADYSFEGSASGSSSQASSMLSSFPGSASILTQSTDTQRRRAPGYPITLHLNMNELIPPAKNTFTFTISGTIIVTPRPNQNSIFKINSSTSRNSSEGEVDAGVKEGDLFTLPKFTVLAADSESTSVVIKNEMNDATIEVYETSSRSRNVDEHTKTATLQKGAFTKCSENGSPRVLVKSVRTPTGGAGVNGHGYVNGKSLFPSKRPRTPSGSAGTASRSSSPIGGHRLSSVPSLSTLKKGMGVAAVPMRPKRDGPLIIPWVDSIVTPLPSTNSGGSNDGLPDAYAVRIRLPAPADTDSEWLEFGLAKPGSASDGEKHRPPRVDIVNVSVEGVPVRFETSAAAKPDPPSNDVVDLRAVEFEQMSGKEWISWIRVHIGSGGGGSEVVVDYVANVLENTESGKKKGKRKARDEVSMEVYLPWFSLPVGRMEVVVEDMPGLDVFSMNTNFRHSSPTTSGNPAMNLRRLLQYSTEAFFYPHLSFRVRLDSAGSRLFSSSSSSTQKYITLLLLFMMISALPALFEIRTNVSHLSKSLEGYSLLSGAGWNDSPEPVTITTTVFTGTGTKWWFGESVTAVAEKGPSSTDAVPISSITSPPIPTIPIPHSHPSPASSDSFVSENSLSSRSPASFVEEYALIHIQKVIDFKWEDMKPVMKKATRVMQETVGVLWKVVSWVWYG